MRTFCYQYANMPYTLGISADDIITAFSADEVMVLKLSDRDLTFDASVQIDVKDAPARELLIETDADPGWTVTSITGQNVSESDADVRDEPRAPLQAHDLRSVQTGVTGWLWSQSAWSKP